MIPTIGVMVAGYAIIRLIQIPLEYSQFQGKVAALAVLSAIGIAIVGLCAVSLILSGTTSLQGLTR